ncbi:hypothetical protein [Archangium sp.]|uniref:hypothetical protein n=1 Tax=Archangium sp. TaxID=1872627 RepID=UPI002ED89A0F
MANEDKPPAPPELLKKMRALQGRLEQALEPLPPTVEELRNELRRILQKAIRDEVLQTPPYSATQLLKLESAEQSRKVKERGGTHAIVGGYKDIPRLSGDIDPRKKFIRDDGAVIHFSITVRESPGQLELIAYDFELYHPSRVPIWFVRFDLNQPGHHNDRELGLRSHVHPAHDDLQIPGAMLSPAEALSFLLYGFRIRREAARTK